MIRKILFLTLWIGNTFAYADTPQQYAVKVCECVDAIVSRNLDGDDIDLELAICSCLNPPMIQPRLPL